jgi:hypothetical protein
MKRFAVIAPALLAWACLVTPAAAQTVGMKAGASVDPDQFYFGGQVETAPLIDQLRFRPNVEIGIGDDLTLVAFNIEFAFDFPQVGDWRWFVGAGPALNLINIEDDTESEGGFNVLAGAAHQSGLFGEVKFGLGDSPDFKIGVGYSFNWR